MAINSEPDVEGANGTRRMARRGRRVAEGAGKATRRRRWMLTAGVLCWWVVLVEAAPVVGIEEPDGIAVGAKMRGRFTVLPQMLRIAGEDPAGGHYRVALSHEPAEDVTVLVEGIEGTDLTVQPSSLTFTPENCAEFWIHGNIRRARPWNIARARSVGRISER